MRLNNFALVLIQPKLRFGYVYQLQSGSKALQEQLEASVARVRAANIRKLPSRSLDPVIDKLEEAVKTLITADPNFMRQADHINATLHIERGANGDTFEYGTTGQHSPFNRPQQSLESRIEDAKSYGPHLYFEIPDSAQFKD